jgi:streptomycin 6-kinase
VAAIADEWELELGRELTGGVLAFVCEVDGDRVLKVAGRWDRPADEIRALRRWAGGPAPRLLRADGARGALLLERVRPATRAADATAGEVAALLGRLHVEPWPGLRLLADVARRRVRRAVEQGRARPGAAAAAQAAIDRLSRAAPSPVLLHGDLDDRNVLRDDARGLVAIDALPCAGDPAYDAACWAHANRRPGRLARIRAIAAAAGLDEGRVAAWADVVGAHG